MTGGATPPTRPGWKPADHLWVRLPRPQKPLRSLSALSRWESSLPAARVSSLRFPYHRWSCYVTMRQRWSAGDRSIGWWEQMMVGLLRLRCAAGVYVLAAGLLMGAGGAVAVADPGSSGSVANSTDTNQQPSTVRKARRKTSRTPSTRRKTSRTPRTRRKTRASPPRSPLRRAGPARRPGPGCGRAGPGCGRAGPWLRSRRSPRGRAGPRCGRAGPRCGRAGPRCGRAGPRCGRAGPQSGRAGF